MLLRPLCDSRRLDRISGKTVLVRYVTASLRTKWSPSCPLVASFWFLGAAGRSCEGFGEWTREAVAEVVRLEVTAGEVTSGAASFSFLGLNPEGLSVIALTVACSFRSF